MKKRIALKLISSIILHMVVQALEKSAPIQHVDSNNYSSDYEAILQDDFTDIDSYYDTEEILNSDSDEENKLLYLMKIGYSEAGASIAMERCGLDSSIAELIDFICATQMAKAADALLPSVKLTERIRKALEAYDDESLSSVQKYVLDECRKWNLVWVGRNTVVLFKPDEVEMLLGFPKNLTRGEGSARDMFPGGINVLSLFSRIGGVEVVFYCLDIPLKADAQELNGDRLEQLMSRFGEFDLGVCGIQLTASYAASRYTPTYPTLPEPWRGLVDSKTGYLYFWNTVTNITPYERGHGLVAGGNNLSGDAYHPQHEKSDNLS
ncbi:hypothetical protein F3Y22_tig00111877pilonHSYRG00377 [Hibiscus syriacus]|uniref:WW domain-containing protein n=1 Tax=Hibiscus syriacus TaxID=106335 RepID=A0A6A2Y6Q0_HIBSY|nr:hypothetical protein F3Y22_tig00111877pilonHSYRG00377 [Hibiscus syriacus]